MLRDVILALGLLLSTASQLRPTGAKIGPGEACLAVWIFLMLAREVGRLGPPLTPALRRLLIFWIVFAVALCLGTMTGYLLDDTHDRALFLHDIVAYGVVAAISCFLAVEPGARQRVHRVCWLLVTIGAAWLTLQAAQAWGLVYLGKFEFWEWDRFRGFSENSNQLALFCAVLVMLSLYLVNAAARPSGRIVAMVCMIIAIAVGRLTQSNAFLFVLLAAIPILMALKLRTWLLSGERTLSFRSASAWIVVLALPLTAAYVVPFATSYATEAGDAVKEMMRGGTTSEVDESASQRFDLWDEAIRRGVESGMLGLGPGPHLEIPLALAARRRDSDAPSLPHMNIAPNFEAHNTVLDLFVQGGFLAVSALGWLLASTLLLTIRARLDELATLICIVALFSIFHMIMRHPIVWFAIALCVVMAADAGRTSRMRARS